MGTSIGLNLGCGDKLLESTETMKWVNVDMDDNHFDIKPDVSTDISKTLPFEDFYADEIMAIHVFEHFPIYDVEKILLDWKRVLKSGGKIVLELPCLNKILQNFANGAPVQFTWAGLYGEQIEGHPEMIHRWCYSIDQIKHLLLHAGFVDVTLEEPLFHFKQRDMRFTARKP